MPPDIAGGYLCFVVSIACIGVLTAVIGDVASHFGCTVGFPDSVTAVTFVALGTSVPGKESLFTGRFRPRAQLVAALRVRSWRVRIDQACHRQSPVATSHSR